MPFRDGPDARSLSADQNRGAVSLTFVRGGRDAPVVSQGKTSGASAGFEPIEHTADVGLRVWAGTCEELFRQAALGMVAILVDPGSVRASEAREVRVSAADLEEALVSFLQEVLYLYEVEGFVTREVEISEAGEAGVRARLWGEARDPGRHEALAEIKAATYHALDIRRREEEGGPERWETTIVFDI